MQRFVAGAINRAWEWASRAGAVSPTDRRGRRYAAMGDGSCIAFPPGAVFGEAWIAIGAHTLVGPHVSLSAGMAPGHHLGPDPVIRIGDRVTIGRNSAIVGHHSIDIGDDVTTGPNVYITDQNHVYEDVDVPIMNQWPANEAVVVGSGSWLGTGVIVLPGARIGRNVTVAAGSVVRGEIPDRCVVAGAPARVVRRFVDGVGWEPPLRRDGPKLVEPPPPHLLTGRSSAALRFADELNADRAPVAAEVRDLHGAVPSGGPEPHAGAGA